MPPKKAMKVAEMDRSKQTLSLSPGAGRGRPKQTKPFSPGAGRGRPKQTSALSPGAGRGRPKQSASSSPGAGRGRTKQAASSSPYAGRGRHKQTSSSLPSRQSSSTSSSDHHSDYDSQRRSRAGSNASSVVSVAASTASMTASEASTTHQALNDKRKRAKKTPYPLEAEEENSMLEFLQENRMLWDIKITDFRRTDKKNKLWEDQAARLGKTSDYLKGWFKSLRDNYTRLDKKKSGDGVPDLTEREKWVKDNFSFLKAATRHRPEPVNSVKAVIDAHPGNLSAAEAACAEFADTGAGDRTPSPTRSISSVLGVKKAQEDDIFQSLKKRVNQSGELLKCISQPQSQPISECTAFANYVRDSLLTMSKRKFRKVRSAINKALTQAMEEDSDIEQESQMLPNQPPNMPPPVRPVKTPACFSSSPSEMYQPPPHMWRHKPPQASVWASATKEYLDQFMQQPLQTQQQPLLQQEQNIMPPYQQDVQQQSSDSLSAVLGPASQVLNQSHNLSDL